MIDFGEDASRAPAPEAAADRAPEPLKIRGVIHVTEEEFRRLRATSKTPVHSKWLMAKLERMSREP